MLVVSVVRRSISIYFRCSRQYNQRCNDVSTQNLCRVSFGLLSKDQPDSVMVHGAWAIDELNIPSFKLSKKRAAQQSSHLSNVDLPELKGEEKMIFIGSDMAHLLIQFEVRQGRWDEQIAVKTPLSPGHCDSTNANLLMKDLETMLQHQIKRLWEIDSCMGPSGLSMSLHFPSTTKDHWLSLKAPQ